MVPIERKKQLHMTLSEEEHAELMQLSEWQRVNISDVVRAALRNLYLSEAIEKKKKGKRK